MNKDNLAITALIGSYDGSELEGLDPLKEGDDYFFPAIECAKRLGYLDAIKNAPIPLQGTVDMQIWNNYYIRFTAKHLVEIQEILRQMPTDG